MSFDFRELLNSKIDKRESLYNRYLNSQLLKVLKTIDFDVTYTKGYGCYLEDLNSNRYLDFLSGFGVFALGRNHPVVKQNLIAAINEDLPNLVQMEASVMPALLAEKLVEVVNAFPVKQSGTNSSLTKVFFTNSGAESVESAIKFAKAFTKKDRIIYFNHAFHGLTTGAISVNGSNEFKTGFGKLLNTTMVEFGSVGAVEKELRAADVAAVIIEPIQGKGVFEAQLDYYIELEEICRKYSTLLIADEVQTGLGRTGKWFCFQHYGINPDIVTVSKALSAGFIPVGAMICSKEIFDSVYSKMERAMVHSSTFGQNHLAMVAGLTVLNVIEEENILENVNTVGSYLNEKLTIIKDETDIIKEVRQRGLIVGIEFKEPKSFIAKSRFKLLESAKKGLFSQLIVGPLFSKHKILTQVAGENMNIIKLLPPLIVNKEQVDYFIEAFKDVIEDAGSSSTLMFDFGKKLVKGAKEYRQI
jgi:acetylornithine/succinyldiaminopimelate/putrescine aminotransferase